jgi:hypothetical protein
MFWKRFFLLLSLQLFPFLGAYAQNVEAGFLFGGSISSGTPIDVNCAFLGCGLPAIGSLRAGHQFVFQGEGAYRFKNFKVASLYLELPIAGIPSQTITLKNNFPLTVDGRLAATFVTPSLRIKLLPKAAVSPFASFGGGLAMYSGEDVVTKGALQYGGGLDVKTLIPHAALRFEVRDFLTTNPGFGSNDPGTFSGSPGGLRYHNIVPSGGLVFSF